MNDKPFTADLLSRCISCGFCLPVCPTYKLTGNETSSPRGRITLMRGIQSGGLTLAETYDESAFCLGCRACETVCPAGVEYGHLLEEWREAAWQGTRRPLVARLLMVAVAKRLSVRLFGIRGWFFRHRNRRRSTSANLFLGCFERFLFPEVSQAAAQLSPTLGLTTRQGCCGALHAHNGELTKGRAMAVEIGNQLPGLIVTTSGGCAAHLSDVIGANRVQDFSQWSFGRGGVIGEVRVDDRRARVGFQDSCHLRNGLKVWQEPRALIASVADFIEISGSGDCCGAAGSYSLLRPRESRAIVDPKVRTIMDADIDFLVTVNPGCTRQMRTALRRAKSRTRVIHLAELLLLVGKF
jgi:glycolate oxidase iron-sulfur subunit